MTPEEVDALYYCSSCGKHYHVPSLARDCEARHRAERAVASA